MENSFKSRTTNIITKDNDNLITNDRQFINTWEEYFFKLQNDFDDDINKTV